MATGRVITASPSLSACSTHAQSPRAHSMDVLIIEDWGLAVLTALQHCDLLEILEDRRGREPTIVTSQLPVSRWQEAIGDPNLADAILGCLIGNAHRLRFTG